MMYSDTTRRGVPFAKDPHVVNFGGRYWMYYTLPPERNTDFGREDWTQAVDSSILYPVYPWEGECIEAASIARRGNVLYIFYAGAYNNAPQQIGVACSRDGLTWKRLFDTPFLPNGRPDVSLLSGK